MSEKSSAGCLVVMNCYGAVQVSYSDIYRVSRAMSQCTYGGQGGIGLMLSKFVLGNRSSNGADP